MFGENISDRNGRAFEYVIVDHIFKSHIGNRLTKRALRDQERDGIKKQELPSKLLIFFDVGAQAICDWLKTTYNNIFPCEIDRLPDSEAQKGDVTDIRIIRTGYPNINLSIKNNHHALKHQRPPSLMQQVGISKKSIEDLSYRQDLQNIFNEFYSHVNSVCSSAIKFKELDIIQPGFINNNLYTPVCSLVASNLSKQFDDPQKCSIFFSFLVGNIDFIKIVLSNNELNITNFSAISKPSQCKVEHDPANGSYIFLHFNNGWSISMRLHTASSRMGQLGGTPSTKFDTQAITTTLNSIRISIN